jgi:hypothetical protein
VFVDHFSLTFWDGGSHGNKPIIISDCSEPSMSKIVQDQTVSHGGVAEAEPTNINGAC